MRKGVSTRGLGVVAAAVPLIAAAFLPGTPALAASQQRAVLDGTHPTWARPDTDRGPVSAATPVTARVYLAGRDSSGLEALAQDVSDPASPRHGQFLTTQQVRERFGADARQVAAVRAWLTSAGLTVTGANEHYLTVSGDAAHAQRAFQARLRSFQHDGRVYRAPADDLSVPAEVASAVLTVIGLSDAPSVVHHDTVTPADTLPGPAPAFVNAGPFSSYYGQRTATGTPPAYGRVQPYAISGYTGRNLRAAYGATAARLTGKGVTVAVVDAYDSPTIGDDAATYAARHGDAPYGRDQLLRYDPAQWTQTAENQCDARGWYGEQTLDIESVHAMAPAARISYVGASSCDDPDLIDALDRVVDRHLADIVSNSWGEPENASAPALDKVYKQIFLRGAAEGIGFYFSSGDNGDEQAASGQKQTDMPASLPWVTAVGGTALGIGASNNYGFETGWGTEKTLLAPNGASWSPTPPGPFTSGAGGGTSARIAQPRYQRGVVPAALADLNGRRMRVVPDIAAVADPNTGFLVGQTQTFPDGSVRYSEYRIGGTSLACPVIAALQALAQQDHDHPIGFANPAIYARYGHGLYHDVTDHPFGPRTELAEVRNDFTNGVDASGGIATSLRTLGHDSSLHATVGYDDVTGVGTPTERYLRSYER
ncbi:S53 family peptidase [Streptacidiphilus rugosus]|uniref:S53 family peptidase n=1 Tax=Streptacidiphilus rugosus TaxID=405783 RepID=UPI00055B6E63|nr:S53 family peptidase [Streptacidiphilus rugosus]